MMEALTGFLEMGGYAGFVWPSFGLTALVMIVLFLQSRRELRRHQRQLEALQALAPHRRRRSEKAGA